MNSYCLKCDGELKNVFDWDLMYSVVECPHCGNKMTVEYDESFNGHEEEQHWWLEQLADELEGKDNED